MTKELIIAFCILLASFAVAFIITKNIKKNIADGKTDKSPMFSKIKLM